MQTNLHMNNPQDAGEHTRVESMIPLAALTDEDFARMLKKILVIIPHRNNEGVHPSFLDVAAKWGRIGLAFGTLKDPHGGFIEIVRGHAERVFLDQSENNPEIEYVVMIDNDQAISWDAPFRLVHNAKDICTGIVCGFNHERGIFACITTEDAKGVPRFPSYRFTERFPGKGLKRIHQCGTGLIAIHRRVFETLIQRGECAFMISEKLRRESYRLGHIKQGEDFSFCDKAREAGFEIWADFGVRALHYKMISLGWPDELLDEDYDAAEWTVSDLDFRGLQDLRG